MEKHAEEKPETLINDTKELEFLLKTMNTHNKTIPTHDFKHTENKYYNYANQFQTSGGNYQNNLNNNVNAKEWSYRYGRNGSIRQNIIREDEELFNEHVEYMKKKKSIEQIDNHSEISIYFKTDEIKERSKFERFRELDISPKILDNLKKMQFDQMTQIQKHVISFILEGSDVMGCAQTGSGKTIAFLLPIIDKMLRKGPPNVNNYKKASSAPVTLILVPTRELAEQIFKEARKLLSMTGINVVKVYGGVPNESQLRELRYGCDILVATPGRLLDFMGSGVITLSAVENFIIDEADRLLDMGFEPQLNRIVFESDIIEREKRQNLLFSATFSQEVRKMARNLMNDCYFISTYKENNANDKIKHILVYSQDNQKCFKLHMILQQIQGSVIIFMDTKKGVDNLSSFLNNANYNTIAIHGDKSQIKRLEAIDKFSNGEVPILIATDVASRGLDFPSVSYVFNFEMPTNIEDYVHRIGRTGRAGNSGVAISFINENNKPVIGDLYSLMKKLKQEIPPWFDNLYTSYKDYKPASSYYNKYQNTKSSYGDKDRNFISKRDRSPNGNDRKPYYKSSGNMYDRDRNKYPN